MRGEHIKKPKGEVKLKRGGGRQGGRQVKKMSKRQVEEDEDEEYYSDYSDYEYEYYNEESARQELSDDEGGIISLNDIETECPGSTTCVETFFCAEFNGNTAKDKIVSRPLLLSSHVLPPALPADQWGFRRGLWYLL